MKICGKYGILPNSYIIPESKIEKLGESPISFGGFSSVWPGMYEEDKSVAIKVLRYRKSDDAQKIKKVQLLHQLPSLRLSPTSIELLPRGHNLEASVSSEHIGVDRSHDGRWRIVCHGGTMDGEWEYRRILGRKPRSRSVETGTYRCPFYVHPAESSHS